MKSTYRQNEYIRHRVPQNRGQHAVTFMLYPEGLDKDVTLISLKEEVHAPREASYGIKN